MVLLSKEGKNPNGDLIGVEFRERCSVLPGLIILDIDSQSARYLRVGFDEFRKYLCFLFGAVCSSLVA